MVSQYGVSSYISDKLCIPNTYKVFYGITTRNICNDDGVYDIL